MKKNISLIAIVAIMFIGCTKKPVANFTLSSSTCYLGDMVTLTNTSEDANSYLWTFPDGSFETAININYYPSTVGVQNIRLTAFSKKDKKSDDITKSLNVLMPTGNVTFWQSGTPSYGNTDVVIGSTIKTITLNYTSGTPSCNTNGCANFTLPVGIYNYNATEQGTGGSTWSGTVTITRDNCTTVCLQ